MVNPAPFDGYVQDDPEEDDGDTVYNISPDGVTVEKSKPPQTPLRHLYQTAMSVQKLRIGVNNRADAMTRGVDVNQHPVPEIYGTIGTMIDDIEATINAAISKELKNWPVYDLWLGHVKGIGPAYSGQLLSLLMPPLSDRGPSTWYKAAGLVPEQQPDGTMRMPRPRAGGGKITYHPKLRVHLYNIASSFIKTDGYYRQVYDQQKAQKFQKHCWAANTFLVQWRSVGEAARLDWLTNRFPDFVQTAGLKGDAAIAKYASLPAYSSAIKLVGLSDETWALHRVEASARWSTISLFLGHLWEMYSISINIPHREHYMVEYGNHHPIPVPLWDGKTKI